MKNEITGSCHCGAIKFRIAGPVYGLKHCHCTSCRKLHGTAFASNAIVKKEDFHLLQGEDYFHDYAIREDKIARFCKTCCSPIYAYMPASEKELYIRTGILDGDLDIKAAYHWWVSEKPCWYEINDGLPQFQGMPTHEDLEKLNRPNQ